MGSPRQEEDSESGDGWKRLKLYKKNEVFIYHLQWWGKLLFVLNTVVDLQYNTTQIGAIKQQNAEEEKQLVSITM